MLKPNADSMVNQHFYESIKEIIKDYDSGALKIVVPLLQKAIEKLVERGDGHISDRCVDNCPGCALD